MPTESPSRTPLPTITVDGIPALPLVEAVRITHLDRRTVLKHCRTWRVCERMTLVSAADLAETVARVTGKGTLGGGT